VTKSASARFKQIDCALRLRHLFVTAVRAGSDDLFVMAVTAGSDDLFVMAVTAESDDLFVMTVTTGSDDSQVRWSNSKQLIRRNDHSVLF
jgi:hypothetical protein